MKEKSLTFLGLSIVILLFSRSTLAGCAPENIGEGKQPVYILKQVIEATGDWSSIEWIQGPELAIVTRNVTTGADAEGLDYWYTDLNYWIGKRDDTTFTVESEALVFRGDPTGVLEISKGANGYVLTKLYAYDTSEDDYVELAALNLGEGKTGPKTYEVDLTELYARSAVTANLEKAIKSLDRKVFAFYYQWYASPEGPSGWMFHWNSDTSTPPYANFPLMGLYDSMDERVIRAHMELAKYSGIDYLIADWPYHDVYSEDFWPKLLDAAEETGLKLTHYGLRSAYLPEIKEYSSHLAFLKDAGRPVFFFYEPGVANVSDWLEFRKEVEDFMGPVVFIGNTVDEEYLGVFDGFHVYVIIPNYPGDDARQYYQGAIETTDIGPSKTDTAEAISLAKSGEEVNLDLKSFFLTVIPGYDDTNVRSPGLVREREGGELYRRLWRTASNLDAYSVLITSWNEWHEGTEIEPSREHGFKYVNMTRELVEEYKQTPLPTPNASFSASARTFLQDPDMSGRGSLTITADEAPALYVNVSISGEGLSHIDLHRDFYTYLHDQKSDSVTVLIPSVTSNSDLEISVNYEAESLRPLMGISVTAYDPVGRLHGIYEVRLQPTVTSSLTALTSSETITIGEQVDVFGFLSPPRKDATILLFYMRPDHSTLTRTVKTGRDGSYTGSLEPDSAGSWRVTASWDGSEGFQEASSGAIGFTVGKIPTSLTIATSDGEIEEGDAITLSGSMDPAISGAEITISLTRPDSSMLTSTTITGTDGSYSHTPTPSQVGQWRAKASWEGDSTHEGTVSDATSFTVAEKPRPRGIPGFAPESVMFGITVVTLLMLRGKKRG